MHAKGAHVYLNSTSSIDEKDVADSQNLFTRHQLNNYTTYLSVWVTKVYFQLSHGTNDGDHGLYCVAVDHRSVL